MLRKETPAGRSTNYSFPQSPDEHVQPTETASRTVGLLTGTKKRVIDDDDFTNDNFLNATIYYDEDGNVLQRISENYLQVPANMISPKNDVLTNQYNYRGLLLASCFKETIPGSNINNFPVNTQLDYDRVGRITSLSKSYNGSSNKKLVVYTYNEFGQMASKKLSPDYNSGQNSGKGLETLEYTYNIQNWLTGINSDYARSKDNNSQWDHYFGEAIGYIADGQDIANTEYNGSISGIIWKSQGDNKPRKYDYSYTNTGYLSLATFKERTRPIEGWGITKYDFSMPEAKYDVNGNLLKLKHKGIVFGQATSSTIDELTYSYEKTPQGVSTNRLINITDAVGSSQSGLLGDFSNSSSSPIIQYAYDGGGSLTKDYNKGVQNDVSSSNSDGIVYNILNKPSKIQIAGKCTIEYIYDADGNKLAKKITNKPPYAVKSKWQYFINDLVLEDYNVQYFLNETGRLRVGKDVSISNNPAPRLSISGDIGLMIDNKPAFFDFYIEDHLENTRMIITEEEHSEYHKATMEISDAREKAYEEGMFGQIDVYGNPGGSNELIATRNDITTPGWLNHYNNSSNKKASKLNNSNKIGPNAFFKVMSGDKLVMSTDYYYNGTATNNNSGGVTSAILTSLANALTSSAYVAGGVKSLGSQIQSQLSNRPDFSTLLQNPTNVSGTPNAHLSYLFFDENFNPIAYDASTGLGSNAKAVGASAVNTDPSIAPFSVTVPSNGYAFVYVSNNSDIDVWFDNFVVLHQRGHILQENHYYPYGLQIASISSKAAGKMDNMYRYQGAYSEFEEETGWNDFELRTYDAQIGRWTGVDPYDQYASGYVGMGNDPVNMTDPSGGFSLPTIADLGSDFLNAAGNTLLATGAGYGIGYLVGGKDGAKWGAALGFGLSAGSYVPWGDVGTGLGDAGRWAGGLVQGVDGVVALVGGADISTNGDISDETKNMEKELKDFYKENHMRVVVKSFSSDPNASTLDDVYNFLKKNARKPKPTFVYGYSLGGHTANQAIKRASADNVGVNLFYAVDAALGVLSSNMEISSNVEQVINVYQTDRSKYPAFSRGYPALRAPGNSKTKILNVPYDAYKSVKGFGAHGAMAKDLQQSVIMTFQNQMKFLVNQ